MYKITHDKIEKPDVFYVWGIKSLTTVVVIKNLICKFIKKKFLRHNIF